ncbi:hypothetical protein BMS3Abin16_00687 [archaeon BMS3Abin16]|nr:hypothetical protein BMS3Abin16_00687 [archaeon BMS3Abin16]HDY74567.1 hypothetical protein [Euryarchaeota archaeon]
MNELVGRKTKSTFLVIAVITVAIFSSLVTYYYQEQKRLESQTFLEVISVGQNTIKIKNSGNVPATGLSANPRAIFEPVDIKPDEVSIGRFESPIYGSVVITVVSSEGSKAEYRYEDESE